MKVNFENIFSTRSVVILIATTLVSLVLFTFYFQSHTQQILRARKEKERYFKTAYLSPISDKSSFEHLNYFEPNEKYRVTAKMEIITDEQYVTMWSSDGKKIKFRKYARVAFDINNIACTGILFRQSEIEQSNHLFMPFRDASNGSTTYQSGRYLDVETMDGNTTEVVLDFNLAYNPYCVYNYKYSCPLAPKENKFKVKILAGEKIF